MYDANSTMGKQQQLYKCQMSNFKGISASTQILICVKMNTLFFEKLSFDEIGAFKKKTSN